jgi:hypothetical protein
MPLMVPALIEADRNIARAQVSIQRQRAIIEELYRRGECSLRAHSVLSKTLAIVKEMRLHRERIAAELASR